MECKTSHLRLPKRTLKIHPRNIDQQSAKKATVPSSAADADPPLVGQSEPIAHRCEKQFEGTLAVEAGICERIGHWPSWSNYCRASQCRPSASPDVGVGDWRSRTVGLDRAGNELLRVDRQLLRETDTTMLKVGLEVGYSSPSHFAQIFRREVGVTPSHYRGRP